MINVRIRNIERRKYPVAVFDEEFPDHGQIDAVLESDLLGIEITGRALAGVRKQQLAWLAEFRDLRYLELSRAQSVPAVPPEVLPRLEVFLSLGRSTQQIDTSMLPSARVVASAPGTKIAGPWSVCPDLRGLTLSGYGLETLAVVDGCLRLEWLRVQGRRQIISFSWSEPLPALERILLHDSYLRQLGDLALAPALRQLYVQVARLPEPLIDLDLSPLAACRQLGWLQIAGLGRLENLDALAGLSHLREVTAYEGLYSPSGVETTIPLNVTPAPRPQN